MKTPFAALAAFLMLRRAAAFCLSDVIACLYQIIAVQTRVSRSFFKIEFLKHDYLQRDSNN